MCYLTTALVIQTKSERWQVNVSDSVLWFHTVITERSYQILAVSSSYIWVIMELWIDMWISVLLHWGSCYDVCIHEITGVKLFKRMNSFCKWRWWLLLLKYNCMPDAHLIVIIFVVWCKGECLKLWNTCNILAQLQIGAAFTGMEVWWFGKNKEKLRYC